MSDSEFDLLSEKLGRLSREVESRFAGMSPEKKSEKLSYEDARDELMKVVNSLETGGATLEQSLKLWERGEELAGICQEWLDGARAKLESVKPTS